PEAVEERSLRAEQLGDRPLAGIQEAQAVNIFAKRGAANPSVLVEDPPGHRAAIDIDGPALARLQVKEWEDGALGSDQPVTGADAVEISERCPIARQHQVIAVVDLGFKQRVMP